MSITVSAKIPDGPISLMALTISFTMTVEEWRKLMRQMGSEYEEAIMGKQIAQVLGYLSQVTNVQVEATNYGELKGANDKSDQHR